MVIIGITFLFSESCECLKEVMERQIRLSLNILEEMKELRQRMDRMECASRTADHNEVDNSFLKALPCSSPEDLNDFGITLEKEPGHKTLLVS